MNSLAAPSVIWTLKITLLLSFLGTLVAISQTSLMTTDELFPIALALDFVISLPVLYFFFIRRTAVPKATVIPVFLASFTVASMVLPEGLGIMTFAAVVILPAVEVVFFVYLGYRIYRTRRTFLKDGESGSDFMERLRGAIVREVSPAAVARAVAFEIAVLSYVVLIWRKPAGTGFTYHRRSSPVLVLSVLLFLLVVETIGIHLLLAMWSDALAWIATAFSIYLSVQLTAHLKALSRRPIVVTESNLFLRCGILGDCIIPRDTIELAEPYSFGGDDSSVVDLLPLGGMSQANIRIVLSAPVTIFGFYGLRTEARIIRLSVDEPEVFLREIRGQG